MEEVPLKPGQNTGVIEQGPKLGDFIAGAETRIAAVERLSTGDWRPYLPTDEKQLLQVLTAKYGLQTYLETNACVSFSADNTVETFMQLIKASLPAETMQWLRDNGYFDASGRLNLSDRFTAKMSNTSPTNGNSLPAVWDSLRNNGAVPESLWPMPVAEVQAWVESGEAFDIARLRALYYKEIPQNLIDLGKEFARRIDIAYDWVKYPGYGTVDTLRAALKQSPLQVATAVCDGWNDANPVPACGPGTQHATMLSFIEPDGTFDDYDHYNPFQKRFSPAYDITYAMKVVVSAKQLAPAPAPTPVPVPFNYTFAKQLTRGDGASPEVHKLQEALQYLKSSSTGKPFMAAGVFGPFGPATAAALGAYQTEKGIKDPGGQGTNFGPQTRAAMNADIKRLLTSAGFMDSQKFTINGADVWKTLRGALITLAAAALTGVVAFVAAHYQAWSYDICVGSIPCFDTSFVAIPAVGALLELGRRWLAGHPLEQADIDEQFPG